MKIALLSEKYTPDIGGLAISTERLARLLTSAGHTVRVFAPTVSASPSEARTLLSNGIHLTRFGAHKRVDDTLVDWFELIAAEHRREPFDILHAYFLPQAGFVAAYAGKYLGMPSVVSIRGNDIERAAFDPSKFSHVMYALQNASAVTTNVLAATSTASTNAVLAYSLSTTNKTQFTKQQIAGRLRQLKMLFEDGLITDDFYDVKVAECEAAQ